jgi:hypothetical protein
MTWRASAWAKTTRTGSPSKKALLMILAEHCDQWGYAWPGQELLVEETEVCERQVRNLLAELAEDGFITIFQARGVRGQRLNLYRLAFDPAPKGEMPPDHPSLSKKFKLWKGTNPPAKSSGGPPEEFSKPTGNIVQTHRKPIAGEPEGTRKQPCASGRTRDLEGAARPNAPCEDGGEDGEVADAPVNTLWREREATIRARIGNVHFNSWFREAIPHADEDGVLILAVPSQFYADYINNHYSRNLAGILGRQDVRAEVHDYARIVAHKRKQVEGTA